MNELTEHLEERLADYQRGVAAEAWWKASGQFTISSRVNHYNHLQARYTSALYRLENPAIGYNKPSIDALKEELAEALDGIHRYRMARHQLEIWAR